MKVFISKQPGVIVLRARAEGPGALGDLVQEVRPGQSAFGKTYEEWSAIETPSVEV